MKTQLQNVRLGSHRLEHELYALLTCVLRSIWN